MPIVKTQNPHFARVPNASARDKRLSIESRGVLAFLLSHKEDFDLSAEYLQRELDLGRDKVKKIIRELKESGYLSMEAAHNKKGNFSGQKWTVYAESQEQNFNTYRPTEKPSDGETDGRQNRQTGNTSDNKRKSSPKENEEDTKEVLSPGGREIPKTSFNGRSGIFVGDISEDKEQTALLLEIFDGLKTRLGTPAALPKEFRWRESVHFTWVNRFTAKRFLETYDLLDLIRKRKGKNWKITPEMIEDNIADIEKLEIELRGLENGTSIQSNTNGHKNGSEKSNSEIVKGRDYSKFAGLDPTKIFGS